MCKVQERRICPALHLAPVVLVTHCTMSKCWSVNCGPIYTCRQASNELVKTGPKLRRNGRSVKRRPNILSKIANNFTSDVTHLKVEMAVW